MNIVQGPGLRAYRSWKAFAQTVAKAVIKEQARLIRTESSLAGLDDHKVTASPVEPYSE